MQLEELVTNRELSQKLKELGYPQDDSELYWCVDKCGNWTVDRPTLLSNDVIDCIAAPLADELGKWLPGAIYGENGKADLIIEKNVELWTLYYQHGYIQTSNKGKYLWECFAGMLIWLVENGHVNFSEAK